MSLQLWIPFTNKVENLGLCNCELSTNNITYVDGKINQYAAHFNAENSWISIKNPPDLNITDFSFAFWLKIYSDNNTMCIYTGRIGLGGAIGFFIINRTIRFDDGEKHNILLPIEKDKWYHIAITRNSTNIKIYLNGNLFSTISSTSFTLNKITYASIGCSSINSITPVNYPLDGDLNDFRIYNHCLSDKEVKELSKGLVLHYKLSKSLNRNLITTDVIATATKSSYYRSHSIINTILTRNDIVANKGRTLWFSYDIYTPGTRKRGTYNANTMNNRFGIHFNFAYNNGTEDIVRYPFAAQLEYSGGLTRIKKSYTIPSDVVSVSLFYNTIQCGVEEFASPADDNDETWYIKNLKLEWDYPTEYLPYSEYDNDDIEYDCSGYGNHGEKHDIIQDNTDIIKYNSNYIFNGTSSYIKTMSTNYRIKDELTINIWAYMDDWNDFDSRLVSCTEYGGYNFEPVILNNEKYIRFVINIVNSKFEYNHGYIHLTSFKKLSELSSGWHMFTATYNGYKSSMYIDAEFISCSNDNESKSLIYYYNTIFLLVGAEPAESSSYITNYFNGKISDLRIYGTALSEDDIKELYNVPTSLDNNGNIFTGELIEED